MDISKTQTVAHVRGRFKQKIYRDQSFLKAAFHLTGDNPAVPGEILAVGEVVVKGQRIPESNAFEVILAGNWTRNKKSRKLEFQAYNFEALYPRSKGGILRVLSSGIYVGVGPKNAERIFDTFGLDAIDIINSTPERLVEVPGIGKATTMAIIEGIQRNQELTKLTGLLAPYAVSDKKIIQIYHHIPKNTKAVIEDNPYIMCDLVGFQFALPERMARDLGIPSDYPPRLQAGLLEILKGANDNGDLYMPLDNLVELALQLLAVEDPDQPVIDTALLHSRLDQMAAEEIVMIERDFEGNHIVFRAADYRHEYEAALHLVRLHTQQKDYRLNFSNEELDTEIARAEHELGIILESEQKKAVKTILTSNVSIILGKPGTGKTLIQRFVLWIHKRNIELNFSSNARPEIMLVTPTGRASSRLAEMTNHPAYTVHRGLGIRPDEAEHTELPKHAIMSKDTRRIICDESSMLDMKLTASMVRKIPAGCQVSFIGDPNQLESVGPGDVLSQLVKSKVFPVVELNTIYRQGPNSAISVNAERIISRNTNLITTKDSFMFLKKDTESAVADKLLELYFRGIKKYGIKNVMIICPRREEVETSALILNRKIQEAINKKHPGRTELAVGAKRFYTGDRIMQTDNTDHANNGELGSIIDIRQAPDRGCLIAEIRFDSMAEDQSIIYYLEDMESVSLGFAMTIHKAEGSEFDLILMPMVKGQRIGPQMLYTAVTRARQYIVLVGMAEAIKNAILREEPKRRTMLADRIRVISEMEMVA